jgi:MFS family permease
MWHYALYSPSQKRWILLAASMIACITPFTDTVYLPALTSVGQELRGDASKVASTVSIYLAAASFGQILFGPVSDYFGRLPTLYIALLLYLAFTVGCIFAATLDQLIILRAFEGLVVAGTIVPVQAAIADIFPVEERGRASGAFFVPILVGPIVAPVLGGFLANAFGWRATFVLLVALAVPIAIFAYAILPETHIYYVKRRLQKLLQNEPKEKEPETICDDIVWRCGHLEEKSISTEEGDPQIPVFSSPLAALHFLLDLELAPYFLSVGTTFAGMFTSLTVLPLYLADSPYNLSPDVIGLCYLPVGVGMLIGSVIGGEAADRSAAAYSQLPDGRMTYLLAALWTVPPGLLGFGYALNQGASLAGVLIAHTVMGLGQAALMPSTMSYLSSARPQSAGAVGSALMSLCFGASAVTISVSVIITSATSTASLFLLLALLVAGGAVITTYVNLSRVLTSTSTSSSANVALKDQRLEASVVAV